MNTKENLIKYRDGYYIILDIAINIQKASKKEIDDILDRINEINKMIDELDNED